jgi:TatD DNase family protein
MKIFDSHCHLDDGVFEPDFEDVIERARQQKVCRMLIAGIDEATSKRAVELANGNKNIFASVGVHPHDAKHCSENALAELTALAADSGVVAWGEIGLDFNRMYSPRKDQEHWFVRQLEIACNLNLPLIFHERDSNGRLIEILAANPAGNRRAVVHCFSGNASELTRYLEMGFYIGITGIVTIKKRGRELRSMLPNIPRNRLLVETDAPYLTPTPQRNKHRRNEPAFVRQVLATVAEVLEEDLDSLAEQVWENTCRLFRMNLDLDKV